MKRYQKVLPTVLIVDDTPANIGVIAENLEEGGYRVLVAQDGEEGLQRAALVQPDLILLDVMMPHLDGFEVCRRLKQQPKTRDIPVIFMTARAESSDKVNGFKVGAVDYVTKPLQIDEVIARIDTQLALSEMQKRLELQNAQLQRYREQLEQRVAERTSELAAANLRLLDEIQERRRAEAETAAREMEFRTLAENAPDNLARYDRQCRNVYTNPNLAATLGCEQADLLGKTPLESGSGVAASYHACLAKVIETGVPDELEVELPDKGYGVRDHHIRFVAERDASGAIIGALAFGRDITEQKAAARLLHAREQAIRAVVENSPDIIARYDNQCRRIYINPAMQMQFGLSNEEILGKTPQDFSTIADIPAYMQRIRRVFDEAKESHMELSFRDAEGRERWGHMRLVPEFGTDGAVLSVLAITRDMTERKLAERELEASRAQLRGLAAHREQVREEERKYIAREVHDELGQILTGLQLNVLVLGRKFAVDSEPLQAHLQETIALTDKALEVARNVASALRPAALDMGIASALEWLAERFSSNTGIRCKLHIEDFDMQLEEHYAIALFRIVQESLTNVSRHAMADCVDIAFGMVGDDYLLKVRDNGTGFDPHARKADSFGLVGIQERALLLGGTVSINSHPGFGTEIVVSIPSIRRDCD